MSRPSRRGRRPGDPEITRRAIKQAARAIFAADGYERATIRAIAARAGVDPALVHHHYGTKADLFAAAHDLPFSPADVLAALDQTQGTLGERVTRLYLGGAFSEGSQLESLIRAALTHPPARAMLRRFIQHGVLDVLAPRLEAPDARLRILLAGSHLLGLFMARRVLAVEPISRVDFEHLVAVVAPVIDHYLTGDLDPGLQVPVGLTPPLG